jgi:hypothetical protein
MAKKAETLAAWHALSEGSGDLLATMPVIPYKAAGRKYGAGGVRVDGPPEFVDAVLARLKDLLDGENHVTRLELARTEVVPSEKFCNTAKKAEVCYIRLHQRGGEGVVASAAFDKRLDGATDRFAVRKGLK